MNAKIVFYGVDNSGKTTACNQLAEIFKRDGYSVQLFNSKGPRSATDMLYRMSQFTTSPAEIAISDRFSAFEEIVYGPLIRGANQFHDQMDLLLEYVKRIDLFVYCCPPDEVINNYGTREQMDGVIEKAERIKWMFDYFIPAMFNIKDKMEVYDWTKDNLEILVKKRLFK